MVNNKMADEEIYHMLQNIEGSVYKLIPILFKIIII